MLLQVGAWVTEEWLERWGPRILDLGFSQVGISTDRMSPGLFVRCLFEYAAEVPLAVDRFHQVVGQMREEAEAMSQALDVRLVSSDSDIRGGSDKNMAVQTFRLDDETRAKVVGAIDGQFVMKVIYEGGVRVVRPHTLYVAKDGNELLLVWQVAGFSSSGHLPGWRNFLTERMKDIKVTDQHFDPQADLEKQHKMLGKIHILATV